MELKITKKDAVHQLKNMFLVIFGTAVLAFGTAVFIEPYNLVTGGVSGLAIVLADFVPLELDFNFYYTVLTWVLFFLGLMLLGKDFAIKTLLSTVFCPVFVSLFSHLVEQQTLNGMFVMQNSQYQDIAVLLAAVCGGACVGAGCAITFIAGGSTGGVDVLAFLLIKVFKRTKSSHLIFAIDAAIVVMGFFVNDIVISLLGIISAFICAAVIDRVFLGNEQAYVAQIVSEKSAEISRGVIERLDRTATIVDVVGAYSGEDKKMMIVSFSMREYSDLMAIINKEDPQAFMTISRAHENHGEGWTRAKK
ncbi:MAG: YitT family protein [Clostridia bacterium]|nr:YitT family protein [Clostridia bacterium]